MNQVYLFCDISRQAHHKARGYLEAQLQKEVYFIGLIHQMREIHPGMGLRKIYETILPEEIGRDAFIALGVREGFKLDNEIKKTRTTFSVKSSRYRNLLAGKRFTDVNQIWSSDITYIDLKGQFYYLVMIMDVYSRRILGYNLANHMRAESKNHGIQISMCDDVYENSHIERLNETIKNYYLRHYQIDTESQLHSRIETIIGTYNTKKPHEKLGGMTPVEYEQHLPKVPAEKRKTMEIYTTRKNEFDTNPNQLYLFNT
jgi:putative transposase